jgi:hypothetical protein
MSSPLDRYMTDTTADRLRINASQLVLHPQQTIRELALSVLAFYEDRAARQEIAASIRKREAA